MLIVLSLIVLGLVALALPACSPDPRAAPSDWGVCWRKTPDLHPTFRPIAYEVGNLDACAAYLEATRLQRLHVDRLTGAYLGYYIYLRPDGIFIAHHLKDAPSLALVRTDDGRLAQPGAVGQCVQLAPSPGGRLFQTVEFAPCVKRMVQARCDAATPDLTGRWGSLFVDVTASQVRVHDPGGPARVMVSHYSGCSPPFE